MHRAIRVSHRERLVPGRLRRSASSRSSTSCPPRSAPNATIWFSRTTAQGRPVRLIRTDRLAPDDGEKLQLVVALAARHRGVDEQRVRLLRVEQRLAVQFQRTELGVYEALRVTGAHTDLVVV